jgi:hypothetical protein
MECNGNSPIASWPGKSAKCIFAPEVPAIHVLGAMNVDARHSAVHDEVSKV